jgi:hypothetical protein
MNSRSKITEEIITKYLEYKPISGHFIWKPRFGDRHFNSKHAGNIAGSLANGYLRIKLEGYQYFAHVLVWFLETGIYPQHQIDHKDQNRSNNQFSNLRKTSHQENAQNRKTFSNNKSGHTGVAFRTCDKVWSAFISIKGKRIHLGSFTSFDEAVTIRRLAELEYFGESRRKRS